MGKNNQYVTASSFKSAFRQIHHDRFFYFLLIPGIVMALIFRYAPMGGLVMAFEKFNIYKGIAAMWESPWVGFKNFEDIFRSVDFWRIFSNTLIISCLKLIFGFPVPILLALMLNELKNKYFMRTVQTLIYLPHFISWVVIAGIMLSILSTTSGLMSYVFHILKLEPVNIMTQASSFRGILVGSELWKNAGWNTIIYIAAFSMIDLNLFEAARIDGAGRLKQIWHITIPAISGIIVLQLILSVGYIMDAGFDQIQVLLNDAVRSVGDIFDTYVYRVGLLQQKYEFTTAVGLFKSVISLIMIVAADRIAKLFGEEGLI